MSRSALGATGYVVLTRALRASARITIVLLLARFYTEADVAVFAYAFVASSLIALVCDLGLTDFAVREIAVATSPRPIERAVLALRIATTPIALIASTGLVTWTSSTSPLSALAIAAYANALSIADLLGAIHRGHHRYARDTLEAAIPTIALVGAAASATGGISVDGFFAALGIVGTLAVGSRLVIAMNRARDASPVISLVTLAHKGRWFAARAVVTTALFELSIVLLEQLSTPGDVAAFAVAQRPVGLMTQALSVIAMVFLPTLSRTFANAPDQFHTTTTDVNLLYLLLVPAAFGASMLGGHIFLAASGDAYLDDIDLVRLLSIAVLAYHGTLTTAPLLAAGRERLVVASSVVGVIALGVAGFAIVPSHGTTGAAIATAIAMIAAKVVHVVGYVLVRLPLGDLRHAAAVAAAIAFVVATYFTDGTLNYALLVTGSIVSMTLSMQRLARIRVSQRQAT